MSGVGGVGWIHSVHEFASSEHGSTKAVNFMII